MCRGYCEGEGFNPRKCSPHICTTIIWRKADIDFCDMSYDKTMIIRHGQGHDPIWMTNPEAFSRPTRNRMTPEFKEYHNMLENACIESLGGDCERIAAIYQYETMTGTPETYYLPGDLDALGQWGKAQEELEKEKERQLTEAALNKLQTTRKVLSTKEIERVERRHSAQESQERVFWIDGNYGTLGHIEEGGVVLPVSMYLARAAREEDTCDVVELSSGEEEAVADPECVPGDPYIKVFPRDMDNWVTSPPMTKEEWDKLETKGHDTYSEYEHAHMRCENQARLERDDLEHEQNKQRTKELRRRLGLRRRGAVRRRARKFVPDDDESD